MDESWLKSLEHGGIKSILWQEFFSCKKRTLHRRFVKKLEGLFSAKKPALLPSLKWWTVQEKISLWFYQLTVGDWKSATHISINYYVASLFTCVSIRGIAV